MPKVQRSVESRYSTAGSTACWAAGAAPLSGARLSLRESQILTEPNLPMTLGKLTAPTEIRVRSGVQGVDYMGPNAFFTAALPRAQFCAVDLIY